MRRRVGLVFACFGACLLAAGFFGGFASSEWLHQRAAANFSAENAKTVGEAGGHLLAYLSLKPTGLRQGRYLFRRGKESIEIDIGGLVPGGLQINGHAGGSPDRSFALDYMPSVPPWNEPSILVFSGPGIKSWADYGLTGHLSMKRVGSKLYINHGGRWLLAARSIGRNEVIAAGVHYRLAANGHWQPLQADKRRQGQ